MKKFVVINELFTASEGWEKAVKCIKKTKEAAEAYCAEQITRNVTDFIEMLQHDAGSQEEVDMIKHYTRKISEM